MENTFIEGTWEDIIALAPKLSGHRVRVTLVPSGTNGVEAKATEPPRDDRPLSELFAEIAASFPEEELAKIPPDFTDQLDHYIYGTPKK